MYENYFLTAPLGSCDVYTHWARDHYFDNPHVISYWWSLGTKPLSLTVPEIFNVGCNAMVDNLT